MSMEGELVIRRAAEAHLDGAVAYGSALSRPRSVQGRVLQELRTALLAGDFESGDRLAEADLAVRLNVSRAPVREALRQLEGEGLVTYEAGRGAVVVGVREDELDGIYRVGAVLEEEIFGRAAIEITDADLKQLERIVEDMEHYVRMGDVDATSEADIMFHAVVARASGLGLLRHMLEYMHVLSRFRTRQKLRRPRARWDAWLGNMAQSHRELIEALRRREPAAAAAAARTHLYALKEAAARDRAARDGDGA